MAEYVVPKRNIDETDPTDITWGWHSAAVPAMTGFKVTLTATGSGEVQYELVIENPATSSGPPEDGWVADSDKTSMNLVRPDAIPISGATTFEHVFFQPGDDWFGGGTLFYNDPIDNITRSLHANETTGFDFFIHGRLRSSEGVTVTGYELILFGAAIQPPLRQHPRADGLGASSARRHWPATGTVQRSNRRGPGATL